MEQAESAESALEIVRALGSEGKLFEAADRAMLLIKMLKTDHINSHPTTVKAVRELAAIYRGQGRWKEAEILETQLENLLQTESEAELNKALKTLDPSIIEDVLDSMTAKVAMQVDERLTSKTAALEEKALAIRERVFGEADLRTLASMNRIFEISAYSGEWERAGAIKRKEMRVRKEFYKDEVSSHLRCNVDLASVYMEMERADEANALVQQTMDEMNTAVGSEDEEILNCMTQLALLHSKQNHWDEAERLQTDVLNVRRRKEEGADFQNLKKILNAVSSLARTYVKQNRWAEAESLWIFMVKSLNDVAGEDHLDTLDAIQELAHAYRGGGRLEDAQELFEHVARQSTLDDRSVNVYYTLNGIVKVRAELAKSVTPMDALRYYELAKEHDMILDRSQFELKILITQSKCLMGMGRWGPAEDVLMDAVGMSKIPFADSDPVSDNLRQAVREFYTARGEALASEVVPPQSSNALRLTTSEGHFATATEDVTGEASQTVDKNQEDLIMDEVLEDVDPLSTLRQTLESEASEGSQGTEFIQRLIEEAFPDSIGSLHELLSQGESMLGIATLMGVELFVKHLLEAGADVNGASDDGSTPLHTACKLGHEEIVKTLLAYNVSINVVDKNGTTPLLIAVENENASLAKLLLENGANADIVNLHAIFPLLIAVLNGNEAIAKLLLEYGATSDLANVDSTTSLQIAIENMDEDIMKLLLENGANVDRADEEGFTPLILAAKQGCSSVVDLLLVHGANITYVDKWQRTPLCVAVENGDESTVRALLQHLITAKSFASDSPGVLSSEKKRKYLDSSDVFGATALHSAAYQGHFNLIALLLSLGADPNLLDNYGRSCLDWAAIYPSLVNLNSTIFETYIPAPEAGRHVLQTTIFDLAEKLGGGYDKDSYCTLSRALVVANDLQEAATSFEQLMEIGTEDEDPVHSAGCDGCGNGEFITGERFTCTTCINTDLCLKCFRTYEMADQLKMCRRHQFLKIPSPDWKSLADGEVNSLRS